jgi:hypothetical protein
MNIGDRVRLMHSRDEGIVVAVKGDIIEIEIEDGFTIPATRKEVVLVSKEESVRFQPNPTTTTSPREERRTAIFADTGIFVAIIPTTQTTFELYLINNTDFTIALNLFQDQQNRFKGLFTSVFKPKTAEYVKNLLSADGDLPELLIQGIYFSDYLIKLKDPITKKVRVKPFIISGKQTKGPIIGKNGYIIQIDGEQIPVNKEKLKESMEDNSSSTNQPMVFKSPGKEIDLHIENLTHIDHKYSNSEMLKIQLNAFELALDQAIAAGQDEIKFIHGIGNGVLRAEIQKRLSKMKNIKFFEDAQKERFGYGATLVKIK